MVHRQHGVKLAVHARAEEAVCRIGAHDVEPFGLHRLHGRSDRDLLLGANRTPVASVRVEPKYGDARAVDAEVPLEGLVEEPDFILQDGRRDGIRDVFERYVVGSQCDAQVIVANHEHEATSAAELLLQKLGVPGIAKARLLHGRLVYGGGDEHIDVSVVEGSSGLFETSFGDSPRLWRHPPKLHRRLMLPAGNDLYRLTCRLQLVEFGSSDVDLFELAGFLVQLDHLGARK